MMNDTKHNPSALYYPHLEKLLIDRGWKKQDLAKLLGRTPAVITNLFNGERKLQKDEAQKIAKEFDISREFVLYGEETPSKSTISRVASIPLTGFIHSGGIVELIKEDEVSAQQIELPRGLESSENVYLSIDSMCLEGFYIFTEAEMPGVPKEFLGKICLIRVGKRLLFKRVMLGLKDGNHNLYEVGSSEIAMKDALVLSSALVIGTQLKR